MESLVWGVLTGCLIAFLIRFVDGWPKTIAVAICVGVAMALLRIAIAETTGFGLAG